MIVERFKADIAVVGMSCLFPGAPDPESFWRNILAGKSAIGPAPAGWAWGSAMLDPESESIDRIYTDHGGFLGDLARFDPRRHGTMPISVAGGEPDQFLALEASMRALEDAGLAGEKLDGERTGIVLGHGIHAHRASVNGIQHGWTLQQTENLLSSLKFGGFDQKERQEIRRLLRGHLPTLNVDALPGLVPNMMTGRIANRLGLMGPNYILDAACASSLIAIDAAVMELRRGRADVMLAGGVNTSTSPLVYMVFCQLGALSRDSRIRPFDSAANGTLLGEGLGILVLKRLEDAERAGDRIYAVIKSVGQSSDGRGGGLMAPRKEGQVLAMRRAWAESGLDPNTLGLLECHGTGIPLGDHTEISSLREIFGERKRRIPHIPSGSVKSMIGHCIPAAGAASAIKMIQALHYRVLPPTLCDEVSPLLGLDNTPFYVNTEVTPWLSPGAPRRAAVNSFGFGGVNAHLILEEASGREDATAVFGWRPKESMLIVARGDSPAELVDRLTALSVQSRESGARNTAADCWAGLDSQRGMYRAAVIATEDVMMQRIEECASRIVERPESPFSLRNGLHYDFGERMGMVACLFPGENSQYPGMLRDLAASFPVAFEWLEFIDGLFPEREFRTRELLFPPLKGLPDGQKKELEACLQRVEEGSEAVFAANQALHAMLQWFGVRPDCYLGHSTGETSAIVASGVLVLEKNQVENHIQAMNHAFRKFGASDMPAGILLTVGALTRAEVMALAEEAGDQGVYLTMDNCPNQAVFWGMEEAISALEEKCVAAGAVCARLPLEWPYHTPHVAPLARAFGDLFGRIELSEDSAVRLYSCATASCFPDDAKGFLDTALAQYANRVRFVEAVETLYADGARIFIETGPNTHLSGFVRDILGDRPHRLVSMDHRQRGASGQLPHWLGQLFVWGVPLDETRIASVAAALAKPQLIPWPGRPLSAELPFIHVSDQERDSIRELIGVSAARQKRVELQQVAVTSRARQENGMVRDASALLDHFRMMDEFLSGQLPVTMAALPGGKDSCQDLGHYFPSSLGIELAWYEGLRHVVPDDLDGLAMRWLGDAEMAIWQDRRAAGSPQRRREWLAGRRAAKQAVRAWYWRRYRINLTLRELQIVRGGAGEPVLYLDRKGIPCIPHISLSHKHGVAVAAASLQPLGIDIEPVTGTGDGSDFLETICGPDERALLQQSAEPISARRVWSWKESAAKAGASGLVGREKDFALIRLAGAPDHVSRWVADIAGFGRSWSIHALINGGYYLALALPAEPASKK